MRKATSSVLSVVISSLLVCSAGAATLVVTNESSNDQTQMTSLWIDAGRYRLETFAEGNTGVQIFKDGRLYSLDFQDDSYTVMDRESLAKSAAAHRAAMKDMSTAQSVQRQLIDTQRMELAPGGPCRVWQVRENGVLTQELCILPLSALRTGKLVRETMDSYNEIFSEFELATPGLPWSDVATTQGLPIRVTTYIDGVVHSDSVTMKIKTDALTDEAAYELPLGMREKTAL